MPTDAAGVSQDDLVFPSGTIHLVSGLGSSTYSVNPHNCLFTGTQQITWETTGGTGQFTGATGRFTGTVSGRALLARDPDGNCSFTLLPPSHEVDKFTEGGTLSFGTSSAWAQRRSKALESTRLDRNVGACGRTCDWNR